MWVPSRKNLIQKNSPETFQISQETLNTLELLKSTYHPLVVHVHLHHKVFSSIPVIKENNIHKNVANKAIFG